MPPSQDEPGAGEVPISSAIRTHIRRNVYGLVAIFLALSGTAYATHPGGADTISSGDIINNEVKSADLANGEVKNNDLGESSVGSGKIADQSVKNNDLSLGASSSNTIADGGIQNVDVANNTLTGAKIDEGTLFNDNSLTGGDIDESMLSGVPSEPTGPAGGDLAGVYPNPTIAEGAVTSPKLAPDAVTEGKLVDSAVTVPKLADLAVTEAKLAPDAVNSAKVQDETLTGADIDESTLSGVPAEPSGPAGGDLAGTYPDPSVADGAVTGGTGGKIADDTVTGDDVLESTLGTVADADKLDGKDSADFKATCGAGWAYHGGVCWEIADECCMTYAQAAAHCGSLGGRLPALNEFIALANGGPNIGTTWLEWASDVTADNEAVYINDSSPTGSQDMDGVRPMVTSSWTRCVRPPAQALGTP